MTLWNHFLDGKEKNLNFSDPKVVSMMSDVDSRQIFTHNLNLQKVQRTHCISVFSPN